MRSSVTGSHVPINLTTIGPWRLPARPWGEATSAAAWAEGRAMTLEQAIEYALAAEAN